MPPFATGLSDAEVVPVLSHVCGNGAMGAMGQWGGGSVGAGGGAVSQRAVRFELLRLQEFRAIDRVCETTATRSVRATAHGGEICLRFSTRFNSREC